eukprot:TRINITY_DN93978_c0_g1_i1.p2 TRINITY_DN93978_c0_g1~~TRINITY_DN93978_c0_g1_i1.p2  ORF type:complete len:196 (+),score=47.32 TRINITY_DN93978_c0_g1_i1:42-629(+)
MAYTCPDLPYPHDALVAKGISAETLKFHHDKHHAGYVTKLNALVADKPELAGKSLEDLVRSEKGGIFNCAAQTLNHTFYWHCLSPAGGGEPTGPIKEAIDATWGGFEAFQKAFTDAAVGHFGSGWAWLVKDAAGKLSIVQTHDAGTPLTDGHTPILTCDVWEHAYYIDFRNDRPSYVKTWWGAVNWAFANENLSK